MSKAWIRARRGAFVRDVLRDFCLASQALEREFQRFDRLGRLGFEAVRELLGQEMNRGLLWRLKDTAHHLFRNEPQAPAVGRVIDWCLGYIFHETIKLKEDAYQQLAYGQSLDPKGLQVASGFSADEAAIASELGQVVEQTRESIGREIARVRFILGRTRQLLLRYLPRHRDNPLLARLLFEEEPLVREVFGPEYPQLAQALFGDAPETLYVLASASLRQGGWLDEAQRAVAAALELAPDSPPVLREAETLQRMRRQLAV